jgi:hypothetical protein
MPASLQKVVAVAMLPACPPVMSESAPLRRSRPLRPRLREGDTRRFFVSAAEVGSACDYSSLIHSLMKSSTLWPES